MKLPIAFNRQQDLMAIKWLVKAVVVYWSIEWLWRMDWVQAEIAMPYTRVVAWELEKILRMLGYEVVRNLSFLTVKGFPSLIEIGPRCLGFLGGGFWLFLTAVLTLPSSSPLRIRIYWLIAGSMVLSATNLLRITVVFVLSYADPSSFSLFHNTSIDINVLAGGILGLIVLRSLTLKAMGIKVFRRSPQNGAAEAKEGK